MKVPSARITRCTYPRSPARSGQLGNYAGSARQRRYSNSADAATKLNTPSACPQPRPKAKQLQRWCSSRQPSPLTCLLPRQLALLLPHHMPLPAACCAACLQPPRPQPSAPPCLATHRMHAALHACSHAPARCHPPHPHALSLIIPYHHRTLSTIHHMTLESWCSIE